MYFAFQQFLKSNGTSNDNPVDVSLMNFNICIRLRHLNASCCTYYKTMAQQHTNIDRRIIEIGASGLSGCGLPTLNTCFHRSFGSLKIVITS